MTQTSGRSVSSVSQTMSSSVSARISTFAAPPRRSARSFTWATDSSPVMSSVRFVALIACSAVSSSVDLPKTAAEHAIELIDAGRDPLRLLDRDVDKPE